MTERPSVLHFLERYGIDPKAELEFEQELNPQRVAEVRRQRGLREKRKHRKEKKLLNENKR